MKLTAFLAAVRIARRSAVRSKGRSLLVVAMIGTPVLGLTAADVAFRTAEPTRAEQAQREFGQADLIATKVADGPVRQTGAHDWSHDGPPSPAGLHADAGQLRALLPAGAAAAPVVATVRVRVAAHDGVVTADLHGGDVAQPVLAGRTGVVAGRAPRGPGEAAVSPTLARAAGLSVGSTLRLLRPVRELRVVGVVHVLAELRLHFVFVADPGALAGQVVRGDAASASTTWHVGLPAGADVATVATTLNAAGFAVTLRDWVLHPPPAPPGSVDEQTVGVGVVVVGLAALEIMLVAGTAFAVGARRQRRELALVAATGGDRAHVGAVVLCSGLVLGVVGSVAGVAGGVALAALTRPVQQRFSGALLGAFDVRPLELLAIAVVGVAASVLSAALPARTASRQDVVLALTGRRGVVRARRSLVAVALLAVAVGVALAWWGAGGRPWWDNGPRERADFLMVLAGAVVAELGFVGLAPALVGGVARWGGRLPLPLRLAVRDAARNRGRTAPAVAAVCAALAGATAVAVYTASDTERQRRSYRPMLAVGQAMLHGDYSAPDDATVRAVAAALPTRRVARLRGTTGRCAPDRPCDTYFVARVGCPGCMPVRNSVAIGDANTVATITRHASPDVERVLRAGGAVVFNPSFYDSGTVTLRPLESGGEVAGQRPPVVLPALLLPAGGGFRFPGAIVNDATARRLGLAPVDDGVLFDLTRLPTAAEERQALAAAIDGSIFFERGFQPASALELLALLGGSLLVALIATGVAVGLAGAESRPDLTTLAAVGAAPRVRRVLAAAQGLTVAGLGAGLGVLAGLVPALAVLFARENQPIVVPWVLMVAALVGVPVVSALPAGLLTRSKLLVERRTA